jgi:hypothetical protein
VISVEAVQIHDATKKCRTMVLILTPFDVIHMYSPPYDCPHVFIVVDQPIHMFSSSSLIGPSTLGPLWELESHGDPGSTPRQPSCGTGFTGRFTWKPTSRGNPSPALMGFEGLDGDRIIYLLMAGCQNPMSSRPLAARSLLD